MCIICIVGITYFIQPLVSFYKVGIIYMFNNYKIRIMTILQSQTNTAAANIIIKSYVGIILSISHNSGAIFMLNPYFLGHLMSYIK